MRSDAGNGAHPAHCAGVACVTASRSGSGKTFGGIRKQRGPDPYPVITSTDGADRMSGPDIGRASDLAGANVVVGADAHDAGGPHCWTLTTDVVSLASVKVPVTLCLGDEFPQPDVHPTKASTRSDAPMRRFRRGRTIIGPL